MKKRVLFTVLMILALFLSACQAIEEVPETAGEETLATKYTGILEANEDTGGLTLQTETGDTITVRSLSVDLRKYDHRKVEATGILGSDKVLTIDSVTQLERDEEKKVLFQLPLLGISVQYPSVWQATAKEESLVFTPFTVSETESVDRMTIARFQNTEKLSLPEYLGLNESLQPKDKTDLSLYASVVVGLDQLSGIKKTSEDGSRVDFYVVRDAWVYRLSHTAVSSEDREKNRNIFFDLVNSFRFIPYSEEASTSTPTTSVSTEAPALETTPSTTTSETSTPAVETPPGNETSSSTSEELQEGFEYLSSRGLGIKIQYPKNWFWEQVGLEVHFSDKPLDQSGTVVMKLSLGTIQLQEGESSECKEFNGKNYCLTASSQSTLMRQMLGTIQAYE